MTIYLASILRVCVFVDCQAMYRYPRRQCSERSARNVDSNRSAATTPSAEVPSEHSLATESTSRAHELPSKSHEDDNERSEALQSPRDEKDDVALGVLWQDPVSVCKAPSPRHRDAVLTGRQHQKALATPPRVASVTADGWLAIDPYLHAQVIPLWPWHISSISTACPA